ncbi:hypothetical protein [Rubrobacter indicoceani]|uniref:hypothetical protein n=1 Tax=Rubrobacter indicoceani TaxID=2051957 RepID=UPI000E5B0130|nr:hypothetical protein [Rubrobacter indicoceani]
MHKRPKGDRPVKEPIRKPWIWVVMAIILLAAIPWYLPGGTVSPIILGMPYWAFISLVFSLSLCAYLSWLCLYEWDVVEEEEERARADAKREE